MAEKLGGVNGVSREALGENRKGVLIGRVIGELGSTTLIGSPKDKEVLSDGVGVMEQCKIVVGESSSESVTSGIEMEGDELGRSRIIHNVSRNRAVGMPSQDDEWRSTKSVICMVQRLLQGKFGLHYEEDENNCERERQENLISAGEVYRNEIDKNISTNGIVVCEKAVGKDEDSMDVGRQDVAISSSSDQDLDSNQGEPDAVDLDSNREEQDAVDLDSNREGQDGLGLVSKEEQDGLALASNQEEKDGSDLGSNQEEQEGFSLGSNQVEQEGLPSGSNQEEQDDEMESIEVVNATDGVLIPNVRGKHDSTEIEGEYYIADLVWGKVRGHPWWPGLIFVPSAASDRAQKYFKRDSYLIAYFGDQSFAWNEASKIKPFQMFFSEMENQGTGERFSRAVDSALDEFARRIELGLSCRCLPTEFCEKIKTEVIENTGIRKESSLVSGGDNLSTAALFQPEELVQSLHLFAESPLSNGSRLQFMKVKAQISTFSKYRFNCQFPILEQFSALWEDESVTTVKLEELNLDKAMEKLLTDVGSEVAVAVSSKKRKSANRSITSRKRRHQSDAEADSMVEGNYLSDLMSLNSTLQNGGNKLALKTENVVVNPKKPRTMKMVPAKIPVLDVVFKNLTLAARSPIKEHHMIGAQIRRFLCKFRSAVSIGEPRSRKRKEKQQDIMETTSTEGFQVMEDSHWTDRVIKGSRDQVLFGLKTLHKCDINSQPNASGDQVLFGSDIRTEGTAKLLPHATCVVLEEGDHKQGDAAIWNMAPETSSFGMDGYPKEHSNPTALTLYFADSDSIPSIAILNKVFSCYGPLCESGTKILSEGKSAKVVFKSQVDAETAYRSREKYMTFGPSLVDCSLNFAPQAL